MMMEPRNDSIGGGYSGFDPELYARYAMLEANNFWFVARNALLTRTMSRHVFAPKHILEIGCGTGFVLATIRKTFPDAQLSGSDIFADGLRFAAERVPTASLFQLDALDIPHRDEFDMVGAFDVLEHIKDDVGALQSIFRACANNGVVVVTVPQHPSLWSRMDEYARHERRYTRGDILEKMRVTGFEIEYVTSFVSLLLPAMWLSRATQRRAPPAADGVDEGFKLHPFTNRLCASVMDFERALLNVGVTFPVGGSLLVVARKKTQ